MKKFTKLALATLCFVSSATVLADGYKGEAPPLIPVSIPAFNGGFEFTVGALYMTPESTNTNYLAVYDNRATTGMNDFYGWKDYSINPDYKWGFVLGLGYVIPGTANDVKLDWASFHNDDSDSEFILGATNGSKNVVLFPVGFDTLDGASTLHASAKVDYAFDAVDLTFGQYLNMGSRLQTRLFAGLRYMQLDDDLSTSYFSEKSNTVLAVAPSIQTSWSGDINSSFNGVGPLFGIKANYYLGAGVSLSGMIDAALLVGQLSLDANSAMVTRNSAQDIVAVLTAEENNQLAWDNQNVISPGFDAKFGLSYKYQCNNGTLLALELGYQVTKYMDVVAQMDRDDSGNGSMFANSLTISQEPSSFDTDVTNFRLAGPYLTLNVKV